MYDHVFAQLYLDGGPRVMLYLEEDNMVTGYETKHLARLSPERARSLAEQLVEAADKADAVSAVLNA